MLALWKEVDFRERLSSFTADSIDDVSALRDLAAQKVAGGKDYFTLLTQVSPDVDSAVLLAATHCWRL